MTKILREATICDEVAIIPLTRGKIAVVDAVDAAVIAARLWFCYPSGNTFYAATHSRDAGKQISIPLHRMILQPPDGLFVDHIDGDGLNNRRSNLRAATRSENIRNRRTNTNNTSGYKGVSFNRKLGVWVSYIFIDGRNKYLGKFREPQEAHHAYCAAAKKYYGEFARFA